MFMPQLCFAEWPGSIRATRIGGPSDAYTMPTGLGTQAHRRAAASWRGGVMRPRGEVRQAVADAAGTLVLQRGCFTGRDVAQCAQVAFEKARLTLKDMVRAGELVVIGEAVAPGVCRPLNVYSLPTAQASAGADLAQAVRRWSDFT